jgi:hypothetical protein
MGIATTFFQPVAIATSPKDPVCCDLPRVADKHVIVTCTSADSRRAKTRTHFYPSASVVGCLSHCSSGRSPRSTPSRRGADGRSWKKPNLPMVRAYSLCTQEPSLRGLCQADRSQRRENDMRIAS